MVLWQTFFTHGNESSSIKYGESLHKMGFSSITWSHPNLTYNLWIILLRTCFVRCLLEIVYNTYTESLGPLGCRQVASIRVQFNVKFWKHSCGGVMKAYVLPLLSASSLDSKWPPPLGSVASR
jgi:hypothetical protein